VEAALDRVGGAELRHALGLLALKRNEQAEARRQFERALTLEPGHLLSSLEMADLAYQSGQWVLALRLARDVLARRDDIARANYLAGVGNPEYGRALVGAPGKDEP
jgi:Tfp pilus assembly protein PilF